ncbi:MAG: hypothetical protein ACYCST_13010 [Acidimicrobiales bacterium]
MSAVGSIRSANDLCASQPRRWCRPRAGSRKVAQRRPDLVELTSRFEMLGEMSYHPISLRADRLSPYPPRLGPLTK